MKSKGFKSKVEKLEELKVEFDESHNSDNTIAATIGKSSSINALPNQVNSYSKKHIYGQANNNNHNDTPKV